MLTIGHVLVALSGRKFSEQATPIQKVVIDIRQATPNSLFEFHVFDGVLHGPIGDFKENNLMGDNIHPVSPSKYLTLMLFTATHTR